ncbi:MAG: hypothetical protein IJY47_07065 [Clostridia bacterium]|nr:hypothetical protein [Clostridia bacterium]
MLSNHTMRPAFAQAGTPSASRRTSVEQRDPVKFQNGASEAEDFHSFHPNAGRDDVRRRPPERNGGGRPGHNNGKRNVILAVAIAAALLLLIVLIIGIALAGGGHITYEDNAYIAYADGDGNFHVAVNGSVLDYKFEGEVEVIPAADHSFAYVTDTSAEGVEIFVLDGKKLESITSSPVADAIAFASLKPGVVFRENEKYYLYSEEVGEEMITKDPTASSFLLSGDASTIVFTAAVENSAGETHLHLYQDGSSTKVAKNCQPVALSNYGDYIYGKALSKDGAENLYIITSKDQEKLLIDKSSGFGAITNINVKGDEILFSTSNGAEVYTCLYRFDDHETVQLAKSYLTPAVVDPTIAIYADFGDIYLEGVNILSENAGIATYYLNKKYEIRKISSFLGKFDSEGKYFYYINSEMTLVQQDLSDDNYPKKSIDEDVIDFAITEKGNVYSLNEENHLRFYKVSTEKKSRIADEITTISLHNYANEIYFTMSDDVNVSVFTSKEGSEESAAKWDSTQISSVPYFSQPNSKRTYAYYYDIDNGWMLFYTSNGRSFKLISNDCEAINGVEIPDSIG